jgi:nitroreductase/NAD-dependent dihydropyrimidine dehydrogenase PreA subunit
MNPKVTIDQTICKNCKICVDICPAKIYISGDKGISTRPERLAICIGCGQCMAACAPKAVQVDGLSYEKDFFEFSSNGDHFQNLIETRRSVRAFKDKPVLRQDLEKIVEAISFSPPSFPPLKVELVVVQDKGLINKALPLMVGLYDKLIAGLKKPIPRYFIRKSMGEDKYRVVTSHLMPVLSAKLPDMKSGKEDAVFRNAPAAIIFHANKKAENFREDIFIALSFGMLKAHSLGIGACVVELIPPPINRIPILKKMFGIPKENEAVIALLLGYPRHQYKRGIKRTLKNVTWF